MLRKLKRTFVLISVALTGLVLIAVLGSTLWTSWATQHEIVGEALERGLDDDLDRVPVLGEMMAPGGEGGRANLIAIAVDVSSDGVVVKSGRSPVMVNADVLAEVVGLALEADADSGTIPDLHVAWARRLYLDSWDSSGAYARVVIVDTTFMDSAFAEQLKSDLLITVGAMLCLVAVAYALASWALAPVARAWEGQRRFVADASHELKTPLAVIVANTEILQSDPGIPPESRRWVESTAEEAAQMKGLVNDLLELARADEASTVGSSGALVREAVDLSEVVGSCALEFDALAFERGCSIDADVEDGLVVQGDRQWLVRMTKILIDNACKYAYGGSVVDVRLARDSRGHATLSVRNRGPIMGAEDLEHVFDRFYRSDKARSRDTGGFGLGLAIAKGIVDAHGGKVTVTSTEAAGTTFTVTLP